MEREVVKAAQKAVFCTILESWQKTYATVEPREQSIIANFCFQILINDFPYKYFTDVEDRLQIYLNDVS